MATVMLLLMLVMVMIGQIAMPSIMMFKVQSAASEAREIALVVISKIRRDLENCELASVTLGKNPAALSLVRVNDFDPASGRPKNDSVFRVYFLDAAAHAVRFRTWESGHVPALAVGYDFSQALPPRLSTADLATIAGSPSLATVMGSHVEAFYATDQSNMSQLALCPPLKISVECLVEASGASQTRDQRYTLSCQVTPLSIHW